MSLRKILSCLGILAFALVPGTGHAEIRVKSGELVVLLNNDRPIAAASEDFSGLGKIIARGKRGLARFKSATVAHDQSGAAEVLYRADEYEPLCAALKARGIARACSANFVVRASASPDDPLYPELWGMAMMKMPEVWDSSLGSSSVIAAVVDTGVDYSHPDLAANMWLNSEEIPGNDVDDDKNGYVDDVHGIDLLHHDGEPLDDNGHGTHVAGTIGAVGNNAFGVVGVNWHVKLMALKFLDAEGGGSLYDAVEAISYAADHGARIINASWGGYGYSEPLAAIIKEVGNEGVVVVAAAGNESNDNDFQPSYPASFTSSNIISVSAVNSAGHLAQNFSNYGATSVDISAPGVEILSTFPGGGFAVLTGTSMATPHVAGLAAMLLSVQPNLSASQIRHIIMETGVPEATLSGKSVSGAVVNAIAALNLARETLPLTENAEYLMSVGAVDSGGDFRAGAPVSSRCQLRIEGVNIQQSHTLNLSLKVGGSECSVGSFEVQPGVTSLLSCRSVKRFKGRGVFSLVNEIGDSVAQASARYAPKGFVSTTALRGQRACRALSSQVRQ